MHCAASTSPDSSDPRRTGSLKLCRRTTMARFSRPSCAGGSRTRQAELFLVLDPAHVQIVKLSPLDKGSDAPSLVASKEDEIALLPRIHEDILCERFEQRRAPVGTGAELQLAILDRDDEPAPGPVGVRPRIVRKWQVTGLDPRRSRRQRERLRCCPPSGACPRRGYPRSRRPERQL